MARKVLFILVVLLGGAIGGFGAWIFHYILEGNADYITSHPWLAAFVGTIGLLFLANTIYQGKYRNSRGYGLLVLGIACGIFVQAIFYFQNPCTDSCNTDFVLKLGGCVILMVDGFGSFYRKPADDKAVGQGTRPPAKAGSDG